MQKFGFGLAAALACASMAEIFAGINAAEYFIDVDPGPGNGTSVGELDGLTQTLAVNVPAETIAALEDGIHVLTCRFQDDAGNWSVAFSRPFLKENFAGEPASDLREVQYQFHEESAPPGELQILDSLPPATELSYEIVPGALPDGNYRLVVTPVDVDGRKGLSVTRALKVESTTLPADFRFGSFERTAEDNATKWTFTGEVGRAYTLEGSENLVDWYELGQLVFDTGAQVVGTSGVSTHQFYRLRAH